MTGLLILFIIWLAAMTPVFLGWWLSGGYHRWHERYACGNCGRVTQYQTHPTRCPTCGSPAARKPIVVRRILPFVWEQLNEDEARTGLKGKPSLWSSLFGGAP